VLDVDDWAGVLVLSTVGVPFGDFLKIETCTECAAVIVENADLLAGVVLKVQKGICQLLASRAVDGILAVRAADDEGADAIGGLVDLHGVDLVSVIVAELDLMGI
jgi:hypothetical protein